MIELQLNIENAWHDWLSYIFERFEIWAHIFKTQNFQQKKHELISFYINQNLCRIFKPKWHNAPINITLYKYIVGGNYSTKYCVGCAALFPEPLPYQYLRLSLPYLRHDQNFDTRFNRCGWHSCPKHNLWRAFADGLIDNDDKSILNSGQEN